MKARLQVRALQYPQLAQHWAASICHLLDMAIAPVGTCLLMLGVIAGIVGLATAASFLVAAGVLFHFAVWFERWWSATPRK
jgi:hypothetical protein